MPTHRTFSSPFKAQMVLEVLSGSKTQAELTREHRLKPDLISRWKRQLWRMPPHFCAARP